jgi:S-DNA-T family DNA segregation ATPase FtsK/SpoIIIE
VTRLGFTVLDAATGRRSDLTLVADPETTVADLAAHLSQTDVAAAGAGPVAARDASAGSTLVTLARRTSVTEGPQLHVDGRRLDPQQTLAESDVVDGCVVVVGDAGPARPEEGLVELRVASGRSAGEVWRLDVGEHTVGAGAPAGLVLDDPYLPGVALRVGVDVHGQVLVTPAPDVLVVLEGEPVRGTTPWPVTGQLTLGAHLLEWHPPIPADAALHPSEDGAGLDYNRPPRLLPPERPTSFKLPMPPKQSAKRPLQILAAITPVFLAVAMAFMLDNPRYLLIGLLSPVMVIGNYVSEKKFSKTSYRRAVQEYDERRRLIHEDALEALRLERAQRRQDHPDPAATLLIALGPTSRLWERRTSDPDYLVLRFGTSEVPSEVTLEDPEEVEHRRTITWTVPNAPVTVPLTSGGVLGIAGPDSMPRASARWAVAQLAALHSPADVSVVVLTDASGRDDWEWVRWLPHTRPNLGQDTVALLGTDADTVARRVAELQSLLTERRKARQGDGRDLTIMRPDIVVVLDGARRLRSLPGVVSLLREGTEFGIFFVCLDADERLLPEECTAVVVAEPDGLRVQRQRQEVVRGARPDVVAPGWAERLARRLSPVRDVSGEEEAASIPTSSRLLDVLGMDPPSEAAVRSRWALLGRTTEAVIGDTYDGPFALDLRRDGPHALIAGTTGAGKSELLQSLVASLAAANRPDAMTFVLVDYKGGSAFKDCVDLPHTVGMVTDLDTHLVERALESLGAELHRREHILADAGAKDLEDYTELAERRPDLAPVPRLALVIDEFASMARELPEFVSGLVNIAQRGRSLGIHLVLATQRPSGVVSPEIRANTNLRIALRVTDPAESTDVIDAPDAARIAKGTPGRAYARLGHASLVPFQAGRVGGRAPGARIVRRTPPWTTATGWSDLARPPRQPPTEVEEAGDVEVTDLKVLVDGIRAANDSLGIPAQHSPWLPALPEVLRLADVPEPGPGAELPRIPFGLEDVPSAQEQRPASLDLAESTHVYFVGAPRSGRSQVLRTLAVSATERISPADLHLHAIDCGNGALLALAGLPHAGVVAGRTETERATRLLRRLETEVARRQELLAEGGWADITEQRRERPDDPLAHVLLLIDRWEGFTGSLGDLDHGAYTDLVQKLMREGGSVGLHVWITGDRTLSASRMAQLTEEKFALRLVDRGDFASFGINPRKVPDDIPPGRGYRAEAFTEIQTAVLAGDLTGQGQAAAIAAAAARLTDRHADVPRSRRAFRIESLPKTVSLARLRERVENLDRHDLWFPVAVGGDDVVAMGPNLGRSPCTFMIGGPGGSGRSTALLTVAAQYLRAGVHLILLTPRSSPLRELRDHPLVSQVFEGAELGQQELLDAIKESPKPTAVLVDDAEALKDCDASQVLRTLVRTGADSNRSLVAAGSGEDLAGGFSGWIPEMRRGRLGLLLSPQSTSEADILGVRMNRSVFGQSIVPGRGHLHLGDGQTVVVQVPATTVEDALGS